MWCGRLLWARCIAKRLSWWRSASASLLPKALACPLWLLSRPTTPRPWSRVQSRNNRVDLIQRVCVIARMAPAFVTSSFLATGATLRRENTGTRSHGRWYWSVGSVAPSYEVLYLSDPRLVCGTCSLWDRHVSLLNEF